MSPPDNGASYEDEYTMPLPRTPPPSRLREALKRLLARVYFGQASAGASDYARALVPTVGETHMRPGEFIQQARRLAMWSHEVTAAAVLTERANGATWTQIASAFGYTEEYVRTRWAPVEQAWLDGEPTRLGDGLVVETLVTPPVTRAEAVKIAEQLDTWVLSVSPELCPDDHPFSDGLPTA